MFALRNTLFLMICCLLLSSVQAKDIIPIVAVPVVPAVAVPVDAQVFWTKFRSYVLNEEQDKIVAITSFPFKTRGDLDDDPEKSYDKETFLKLYKLIFNQFDRRAQKTVKEVIKTTELLLPKNVHGDNKIRIENLVFRKQDDGQWMFTFAYVLEDDIKSLFNIK